MKTDSDSGNIHLAQALNRLPGILAMFDVNGLSPTYGIGDRYYWAWKLIDFGNGTFQGAAHGLARLLSAGLLPPEISEAAVIGRIDAMFEGARRLTRRNGSLEEAFPHESSFCVTALVAFDLLCAIDFLGPRVDEPARQKYLDVVAPMIRFLHVGDESHAFISNHLATAAAALLRWSAIRGREGEDRGKEILGRILREQSSEGWFREYEGSDPGYQSLATYYLADIHELRPDLGLVEPLERSIRFLWHFAHPDGSFGGLYGSRNTRFLVPAGIEALARRIPEAAALAVFTRGAMADRRTVTLDTIDPPNLMPFWNASCRAAAEVAKPVKSVAAPLPELPCQRKEAFRRHFPDAGLLIDGGPDHYQIVSHHKGGVFFHFDKRTGRSTVDPGAAGRDRRGRLYSTQASRRENPVEVTSACVKIESEFTPMHHQLPRPWQFAVLRLASTTVLRFSLFNAMAKRFLVRLLITGTRHTGAFLRRTVSLGPELAVEDVIDGGSTGFEQIPTPGPFSAIHMASQGYWQVSDDGPVHPGYEFRNATQDH